jgi:hypothetical protein
MGKKSKVASSNKLKKGKIDPATLPEDKPPPVEEEVGCWRVVSRCRGQASPRTGRVSIPYSLVWMCRSLSRIRARTHTQRALFLT